MVMDFATDMSSPAATGAGYIQSITYEAPVDPGLLSATAAPVVTESMDLDNIYSASLEAEMAQAQLLQQQQQQELAQAQAIQAMLEAQAAQAIQAELQRQLEEAQALQAAMAAQAASIATVANYDQAAIDAFNQQAMSTVVDQNQVYTPEMPPIGAFGEGALTMGGFTMPTAAEKEIVYKIVAAEGGNIAPQEARNILSTMINRAKTGGWGGNNLHTIATRPGQYVVYEHGNYKTAALTPESRAACDALLASTASGLPADHVFQSFRSAASTSYSNNQLVPGGNRYGVPMA